jgi:Tfp pilus assembly protein PilN
MTLNRKNKDSSQQSSQKTQGKAPKKAKEIKIAPPTPPSVSLLPPRLEFEKNKRSTKRGMLLISTGFVISCVVLFGGQLFLNFQAQGEVNAQQEQIADVEDTLSQYEHLESFLSGISSRNTLVDQLQGSQLNYVTISNDLLEALPDGAVLTTLSLNLSIQGKTPVETAAQCGPVVDPIGIQNAVIVGCLKATITVSLSASAAQLTEILSQSEFLINVDISSVNSEISNTGETPLANTKTFAITSSIVQSGLLKLPKTTPIESQSVSEIDPDIEG